MGADCQRAKCPDFSFTRISKGFEMPFEIPIPLFHLSRFPDLTKRKLKAFELSLSSGW